MTQKHPEKVRPFGTAMKARRLRCDYNRKSQQRMKANDVLADKGKPNRTYGCNRKMIINQEAK